MKRILLTTLFFVAFQSGLFAQEPKLKKIFNGKNLDGWVVPANNHDNWTVKDDILYVKSDTSKKGSNLWTEKKYTNFIISAEFIMLDGTVDSGIFLRGENDQIQIGISGSLKRDLTASPYLPKLKYPVEANVKDILKLKDWNTMKVKVVDKTYTVWLNGVEVMTYTSEEIPANGPVGLQLHPGNVMSINYRNILLAEL
ncbi:MAG: DUF1080 domain-containing protein [Bacteroidota bacterium]